MTYHLGGVDLAGAQFGKINAFGYQLVAEFFQVVDFAHGNYGKGTQVGTQDYGLRIVVANHAYSLVACEFMQLVFEFVAEIAVFYAVYGTFDDTLLIHGGQPCPFGPHM